MISAIVVLYYPNALLLGRLLKSVAGQVDTIIAVDNTPKSLDQLPTLLEKFSCPVSYVPLGDNMGIATAQNVGICKSLREGYSHVLLLDQDSCPRPNMVSELLSAEEILLKSNTQLAAVGPMFIDEKNGAASKAIRHGWFHVIRIALDKTAKEPVESDYIISSGSLIRASVFEEFGTMLDELFIDWVDIEWGLRTRRAGSKCYVVPSAVMAHSIGDSSVRLAGEERNIHNDIRNFYIVRNATYLLKLRSMGWRWRTVTILKIPLYVCFYSLHSSNRWNSFEKLCGAILDGIRGKVGRIA
jgi:rhamnosyltransferase